MLVLNFMIKKIGVPFTTILGNSNVKRTLIVVECECGIVFCTRKDNIKNLKSCGCLRLKNVAKSAKKEIKASNLKEKTPLMTRMKKTDD